MRSVRLRSDSAEATHAIGMTIGSLLVPGDRVGLEGPLGAGKTALVGGLARGLDVPDDQPIASPTYLLAREHHGRVRLIHADTYRLASEDEWLDLGLLDEAADGRTVLVLEWADRFRSTLDATWWITLDYDEQHPTTRSIAVFGPNELIDALRLALPDRADRSALDSDN